jgi:hypothetical protein
VPKLQAKIKTIPYRPAITEQIMAYHKSHLPMTLSSTTELPNATTTYIQNMSFSSGMFQHFKCKLTARRAINAYHHEPLWIARMQKVAHQKT